MGARLPSGSRGSSTICATARSRSQQLLGDRPTDPTQMPEREGWLLMRHPNLENAFMAHIVSHDPVIDHGDGFQTWTFPVALAWTADMDTVMPWRSLTSQAVARAKRNLIRPDRLQDRPRGIVFSKLLNTPPDPQAISNLLTEWSGVQRRMWALLATINDLPVMATERARGEGICRQGSYRRFLDYNTITLTVPQKDDNKVIREALAIAHRRGGSVREHWRRDWRQVRSRSVRSRVERRREPHVLHDV